jgi:hypothetical protein
LEIYKKQMEARETAFNKKQETAPNIPETEMILQRMRDLNKKEMYTGNTALPMAVEGLYSMVAGHKSEKGRNTELFGMDSGDLQAAIIKDYGSGNSISDADLVATAKRVITAGMDPKSREIAIQRLQDKLDAHKFMQPILRQYVQQGVPPQEALNAAWEQYKGFQAQQKAQAEAAKAETTAKAEAAKAASPTSTPSRPTPIGPEGQTYSMRNPNSALSQTVDALTDVAKNTGRGAMNLVGLGDREAAVADVERQQGREASEPIYRGAKQIADVAKYAPALALGPLGGAGYSALMSASQPKESLTGQLMSGTGDAAIGAATMGTLNSSRLALVKTQMGKLADVIDTAAHNSSAYRTAVSKMAELEQEFMKLSGRTASETLAPITGAVKSGWNALPKSVRHMIETGAGGSGAYGLWKLLSGDK